MFGDFRVDTIGNAYKATPLAADKNGKYVARAAAPSKGFAAFFVELVYDTGAKNPFKFTTEVSIVPDKLPYQWRDATAKYPLK